ncbi:xanthine dehydrogenase family protein molybdopterin-binding subunit [Paraburkholderia elongata]|uniref:Molybdopterin-dependent oxidoreductase n=1 Tax=Paraburkholderia elongata TaxID=2675747 RepID=A0A972SM03_9BURK|nr:molybdopterin cofactor-binding domain-containing protein [Paraburkholderia elongata]NPT59759.1 molybdopterin-dependent oxidoreductase [Paraburkholderia elongata]
MTNRRQFLRLGGGLAISFALPVVLLERSALVQGAEVGGRGITDAIAAGKTQDPTHVAAWLAIGNNGNVTLHAGKVELGTGMQTALAQLVAEELDVSIDNIVVTMGDTSLAVDQGPTVGSQTMKSSTLPVRKAAATARALLIARASNVFGIPADQLSTRAGRVYVTTDPNRSAAYRDLVPAEWATLTVDEAVPLKRVREFSVIGKPVPRVDLPGKVKGSHPYLQNLRLPGMVHARVIHPPITGSTLVKVDRKSVAELPGFIDIVVKRDFVAVVCQQEFQAVAASRALTIEWKTPANGIDSSAVYDAMRAANGHVDELRKIGDADTAFSQSRMRLSATYRTPYQTHGSIGPSCGVADVKHDSTVVWSATQGSFPLRDAIAALIGLPKDKVRVIWTEGAGCYGQNGADDASAEAAVVSQALGRPVRVQWMRNDEHGWDPKCPATESKVEGSVGPDGKIRSWSYMVSTPTHISRPMGSAGNLLPGRMMGLPPKPVRIGGDHCARTLYTFPNERVVVRWLPDGALRPSAMRGLGAVPNTFANESFLDELANLANRDPIDFRIAHLRDERAIAVLEEVRRLSNWISRRKQANRTGAPSREGIGVSVAQLEPGGAYVATVCSVTLDMKSGETRVTRVFVAHDCGLIVNPDGLRNQIQGCVVQTLSRTLKEEVRFSSKEMLTLDWASYPILRFSECPSEVTISLIDRPDKAPVGAGEPTALTIAPAVGNAIFHATGVRIRKTPFTAEQFKASRNV